MTCAKTLSWYELVPVFSFLAQRGKCSGCRAKISAQYPAVELLAGLLFMFIFLKFQNLFYWNGLLFGMSFAFYSSLFALLLIIAVYDLRHKIIPDTLSLIFGILAFAGLFFYKDGFFFLHLPGLYDLLAGPVLALPFVLLWAVSSGRWMGLGDGKLALGLGWMLGITSGFSAIVLAFWVGAGIGLLLLFFSKKHGIKSEIPFAPFMVLGAVLVFLFSVNFFPVF